MLRQQNRQRRDRSTKRFICHFGRRRLVHIGFEAQHQRRQAKCVRHHANQKLLPCQPQIRIGSLRKPEHLRLLLGRNQRHPSRALDLVLPPANQPVVLYGCGLVQPQRILRHRVRRQFSREPVRAQKLIHGFKCHFQRPQPEGRKAARVHADVHQLVVHQLYRARLQLSRHGLRVARHILLPVPPGVDADRRPVHRPQHRRPLRIAGRLHLDGPEAARQSIFDRLLNQCAKAICRVRLLQRAPQRPQLALHISHVPGLEAPPHPHLPVHGRDTILDHVDRPPHHWRLRKPPQIHRRRFGQMPSRKLHRAKDRGQSQSLALRLCRGRQLCSPSLSAAAVVPDPARLPPHLPQLLAYLHMHLPRSETCSEPSSKTLLRDFAPKTKGHSP